MYTVIASEKPAPPCDQSQPDPSSGQANAFLDQAEGKPSRLFSLEAVHALRFYLAALASAEHGRRVACTDIQ